MKTMFHHIACFLDIFCTICHPSGEGGGGFMYGCTGAGNCGYIRLVEGTNIMIRCIYAMFAPATSLSYSSQHEHC